MSADSVSYEGNAKYAGCARAVWGRAAHAVAPGDGRESTGRHRGGMK
jgi:hypothetical protein